VATRKKKLSAWVLGPSEPEPVDAGLQAIAQLGARSLGYEPDGKRIVFRLPPDAWGEQRMVARHELSTEQARTLFARGSLKPEDIAALKSRGIEVEA
jgi:hypothetical protein